MENIDNIIFYVLEKGKKNYTFAVLETIQNVCFLLVDKHYKEKWHIFAAMEEGKLKLLASY